MMRDGSWSHFEFQSLFANKFLNPVELGNVEEVLKMSLLGQMIFEDTVTNKKLTRVDIFTGISPFLYLLINRSRYAYAMDTTAFSIIFDALKPKMWYNFRAYEVRREKMNEEIRLNKYLGEMGVCSRREADRLIEAGKVTVDGATASMGMKVKPGQRVVCDGKVVGQEPGNSGRKSARQGQGSDDGRAGSGADSVKHFPKVKPVLLVVNKPRGIVCTTSVSYTHLDVYKRQGGQHEAGASGRHQCGSKWWWHG